MIYQIDYIIIIKRFRNAVNRARKFPEADCNSNHIPVVIDIALQLKKPKKRKLEPKVIIKLLKRDSNIKDLYSVCVRNKFETLREEAEENTIRLVCDNLSVAIEESSIQILPKITSCPKRPCMMEAILTLMDNRRKSRGRNE